MTNNKPLVYKYTNDEVKAAMKRATGYDSADLWYLDSNVNTIIAMAVALGWACRMSTTQVHWRDAGIEACF